MTPGRMNVFQFKHFEVLVDFAHNPDGFEAISKYLEKVDAHPKVGLIAAAGDRRMKTSGSWGVLQVARLMRLLSDKTRTSGEEPISRS